MEIPKFLEHMPVYQGLPVPHTVMWVDGKPDFRVIDHSRVQDCVMNRLCAICGRKMGEYLWFVGGPKSLEESSLFVDPPQHEKCARFALEVCPFLSGKVTKHNDTRPLPKVKEFAIKENCLMTPDRSEKVGMRKAKNFELVNVQGHGLMYVRQWWSKPIWLA